MPSTRPTRSEAATYYFTYIDQVPDGDIRALGDGGDEWRPLLRGTASSGA